MQVDTPADHFGEPTIQTGGWDAEFCGCLNHLIPNCCMVFFCPCVSLAQILVRLGIMAYHLALIASCAAIFCFAVPHCVLVWYVRKTTRERFRIPGNPCVDCCAAFCCSCCVTAQVATHIKSYDPGHCDFGAPDTLPAFK